MQPTNKLLLTPLLPPLPLLVTSDSSLTDSPSEVDSEVDSEDSDSADSEEMPTHGLRSVTTLNSPPLTLLMTPTSTLSPNT